MNAAAETGKSLPLFLIASAIALRFAPSTNSMTMKYALSPTPMSKTWTQFECESCAERRASSKNIEMNFFFSDRCGRTRLIATCFLKP